METDNRTERLTEFVSEKPELSPQARHEFDEEREFYEGHDGGNYKLPAKARVLSKENLPKCQETLSQKPIQSPTQCVPSSPKKSLSNSNEPNEHLLTNDNQQHMQSHYRQQSNSLTTLEPYHAQEIEKSQDRCNTNMAAQCPGELLTESFTTEFHLPADEESIYITSCEETAITEFNKKYRRGEVATASTKESASSMQEYNEGVQTGEHWKNVVCSSMHQNCKENFQSSKSQNQPSTSVEENPNFITAVALDDSTHVPECSQAEEQSKKTVYIDLTAENDNPSQNVQTSRSSHLQSNLVPIPYSSFSTSDILPTETTTKSSNTVTSSILNSQAIQMVEETSLEGSARPNLVQARINTLSPQEAALMAAHSIPMLPIPGPTMTAPIASTSVVPSSTNSLSTYLNNILTPASMPVVASPTQLQVNINGFPCYVLVVPALTVSENNIPIQLMTTQPGQQETTVIVLKDNAAASEAPSKSQLALPSLPSISTSGSAVAVLKDNAAVNKATSKNQFAMPSIPSISTTGAASRISTNSVYMTPPLSENRRTLCGVSSTLIRVSPHLSARTGHLSPYVSVTKNVCPLSPLPRGERYVITQGHDRHSRVWQDQERDEQGRAKKPICLKGFQPRGLRGRFRDKTAERRALPVECSTRVRFEWPAGSPRHNSSCPYRTTYIPSFYRDEHAVPKNLRDEQSVPNDPWFYSGKDNSQNKEDTTISHDSVSEIGARRRRTRKTSRRPCASEKPGKNKGKIENKSKKKIREHRLGVEMKEAFDQLSVLVPTDTVKSRYLSRSRLLQRTVYHVLHLQHDLGIKPPASIDDDCNRLLMRPTWDWEETELYDTVAPAIGSYNTEELNLTGSVDRSSAVDCDIWVLDEGDVARGEKYGRTEQNSPRTDHPLVRNDDIDISVAKRAAVSTYEPADRLMDDDRVQEVESKSDEREGHSSAKQLVKSRKNGTDKRKGRPPKAGTSRPRQNSKRQRAGAKGTRKGRGRPRKKTGKSGRDLGVGLSQPEKRGKQRGRPRKKVDAPELEAGFRNIEIQDNHDESQAVNASASSEQEYERGRELVENPGLKSPTKDDLENALTLCQLREASEATNTGTSSPEVPSYSTSRQVNTTEHETCLQSPYLSAFLSSPASVVPDSGTHSSLGCGPYFVAQTGSLAHEVPVSPIGRTGNVIDTSRFFVPQSPEVPSSFWAHLDGTQVPVEDFSQSSNSQETCTPLSTICEETLNLLSVACSPFSSPRGHPTPYFTSTGELSNTVDYGAPMGSYVESWGEAGMPSVAASVEVAATELSSSKSRRKYAPQRKLSPRSESQGRADLITLPDGSEYVVLNSDDENSFRSALAEFNTPPVGRRKRKLKRPQDSVVPKASLKIDEEPLPTKRGRQREHRTPDRQATGKRRGRSRKQFDEETTTAVQALLEKVLSPPPSTRRSGKPTVPKATTKRRGRPRKNQKENISSSSRFPPSLGVDRGMGNTSSPGTSTESSPGEPCTKRPRGRPRKVPKEKTPASPASNTSLLEANLAVTPPGGAIFANRPPGRPRKQAKPNCIRRATEDDRVLR